MCLSICNVLFIWCLIVLSLCTGSVGSHSLFKVSHDAKIKVCLIWTNGRFGFDSIQSRSGIDMKEQTTLIICFSRCQSGVNVEQLSIITSFGNDQTSGQTITPSYMGDKSMKMVQDHCYLKSLPFPSHCTVDYIDFFCSLHVIIKAKQNSIGTFNFNWFHSKRKMQLR